MKMSPTKKTIPPSRTSPNVVFCFFDLWKLKGNLH
jgi:hypothetical protein